MNMLKQKWSRTTRNDFSLSLSLSLSLGWNLIKREENGKRQQQWNSQSDDVFACRDVSDPIWRQTQIRLMFVFIVFLSSLEL